MSTKAVNIRMDESLVEYLQEQAKLENRTLSNMVISILESYRKERDSSESCCKLVIEVGKENMAEAKKFVSAIHSKGKATLDLNRRDAEKNV